MRDATPRMATSTSARAPSSPPRAGAAMARATTPAVIASAPSDVRAGDGIGREPACDHEQHDEVEGERGLHDRERSLRERERLQRPAEERDDAAEQPAGTSHESEQQSRPQHVVGVRMPRIERLQCDADRVQGGRCEGGKDSDQHAFSGPRSHMPSLHSST